MFWQKPFILLGLLAGAGIAAPTLSKRVERLDVDMLNEEFIFFRADTRGPDVIKKANGFDTMAKTNKLPENTSLWDHCKVKDAKAKFGNLKDDAYVSTSSDFGVCIKWVTDYIEDPATSTIYKVASDRNLIGCHDTLKQYNPLPDEQEYAALGGIPWKQVMGWYNDFTVRGKTITEAVFTENPDFDATTYNEKPDGSGETSDGSHFALAGWPKNDKRWKEEPWASAKPVCGADEKPTKGKKKNARRDIGDMEIDDMEIDENLQSTTQGSEDIKLVARARKGSKVKKPTIKLPTKKPVKLPTKKPTKTPTKKPTKTPTKKPTKTPKEKCTAAMKKAGKCGTTCTAAEKKKNGGKCPAKDTCTAAEKKKNGGKCPAKDTCTAAEKKANGGKCPTCTAAEKKANGGKCPPKACPMPKSNKQLAEEYLKLYKAGTLGKSTKPRPKTGKPAKPGKKVGSV